MFKPLLSIVFALALVLSACGAEKVNGDQTSTPEFFTPALPVTSTPVATFTLPPPTTIPTITPIEGTTNTQVNVRAEPSTTSAVLGMILPSDSVQVTGKDASGTWYQLIYPEGSQGKGWVIAAYVQVAAGAEVPAISVGADAGSSASVLVVQRVNVRSGPGTQFETIGILSPNDVVALTGKDSSAAWLQIEYAAAPEARGWINAEFVQTGGAETVPVVGELSASPGTETPSHAQPTPFSTVMPAFNDEDSAEVPSVSVAFSPIGARVLQFSSEVSSPQGDNEDWVQFTPYGKRVEISVACMGSSVLSIQLLTGAATESNLACAERQAVIVQPGQTYLIHLAAGGGGEPSFTRYTLKVEQLP